MRAVARDRPACGRGRARPAIARCGCGGIAWRSGGQARAVVAPAPVARGPLAMNVQATEASWPAGALRPMREDDLDQVMAIELRAYPFPWSLGIFRDCLRADH